MKVYFRAVSLLISLAMVLAAIAYLHGGSFRTLIESKSREWGFGGAGEHALIVTKSTSFRLCRTRIDSIEWSNHVRIFEDKTGTKAKWMSQASSSANARELDYLDIEKWFGINCEVRVRPWPEANQSRLAKQIDFVVFHFVDGATSHIKRTLDAGFLFDQSFFKSTELANSLSELYQLGSIDLPEPRPESH